ncbi:MAG: hypothetical protein IIY86_00070 [Lachnospiraceae bacterium]|nr:hypothetical protein [Lachnospiraceae bacterium]
MKRYLARAGILAAVFIVAAIFFSILTSKGNQGTASQMATPSLPRLSFSCQGYNVNPLSGYVGKLDEESIHGDILPLDPSGIATMYVTTYDKPIEKLTYQVRSMSGIELLKGKIKVKKDPDQQLTAYEVDFSKAFDRIGKDMQTMLTIKAEVDDETVTYMMRLVMPDPTTTRACLDFAQDVHDQTLQGQTEEGGTLESMLESADLEEQALDYVTIESDYEYVVWKNMKPQPVGNVTWFIHEANSVSTSVSMRYQVIIDGLGDNAIHTVDEFFRIRGNGKQMYLLDYVRRMDHQIPDTDNLLGETGVDLGVTHKENAMNVDSAGTNVAFVQNETVYEYNKKKNALVKIFGFAEEQTGSFLPDDNQRDYTILKVTGGGDVIFSVAGYMPRGAHEGRVGISLYHYNYEKNYVAEILFVPSQLGYEVARDDLESCLCYGGKDATYYVVANETLSRLRVGAGGDASQKVIQEGMTADRFKVSQDGSQIAYIDEDGDIKVLNLRKDNSYSVKAPENEELIPVGFIGNDLCYGLMNSGDIGQMVDGREVHPIYRIVLCNRDKDNLMTYEKEGVLMREARVENGTVVLERIQKSGGTYVDVADDYIQSNAASKTGNIEKERITGDDGIERINLTYANGVSNKKPHFLTPKQSFTTGKIPVKVSKNNYHNRYYIFGYGRAAGGEDLPGDAVLKADKLSGVVTLGAQGIYWERGNRDIIYDIPNITFFKASEGQSPREAAEKHMLSYCKATKSVDLSECTIEQLLYLINQHKPVVALTEGDNALLIYGYSETSIHCVDARTGEAVKLTYEEFEGKAKAYLSADPMTMQ